MKCDVKVFLRKSAWFMEREKKKICSSDPSKTLNCRDKKKKTKKRGHHSVYCTGEHTPNLPLLIFQKYLFIYLFIYFARELVRMLLLASVQRANKFLELCVTEFTKEEQKETREINQH